MTVLNLFVLGAPRVERAGQSVEVGLRRALALLTYLAVTNAPQDRERLAGLLWPDSDDRAARGRLRRTLHRLAADLGTDLVEADGDLLRLSPGAGLWLDSRAFEADATAGLAPTHGDAGSPAQREHLTRAAALYQDDFMAGFSLPDAPAWEEWQFLQREQLRQLAARVLRALVRVCRTESAWDDGIAYARRWLALDTLHEPAHRALMQLYALAGQPAAALRQYQACVRRLEAELGTPPENQTTALYQAIKARRLAVPAPAAHAPTRAASPAPDLTAPAAAAPSSLATAERARRRLPVQPTALVGRQLEQTLVAERLLEPETRLVTLTGPGGVGKTHLAVQVASDLAGHFADGVAFVGLAAVLDPTLVGSAIAQVLGVGQTAGRPSVETIADELQARELLLLLDNFEHLLGAAPLVAELLASCPRLKVLITSRTLLRLRGEKELVIPPLALPDREHVLSLPALAAYPAVALFAERARDARPGFAISSDNAAAVAEICRRLDGLPLAIELAAARVKLLAPQALLARLDHRLALLTGGPLDLPARQQTLRNTIAWSFDLLDPAEQALFRRLAIFVGGCDLDAAEAICGSADPVEPGQPASDASGHSALGQPGSPPLFDVVASLVDKSLLRWEEQADGEPRLQLLETLREFGLEQLELGGEAEVLRERHARYYVALAERAATELVGPDQQVWLERLEHERGNLRALARLAVAGGETERIVRLAAALWRFWFARADEAEAREWINTIRGLPRDTPRVPVLVRALDGAGALAMQMGDYAVSLSLLDEAIAVARQLDDRRGLVQALGTLGRLVFFQGRYAEARAVLDECLALSREVGDRDGMSRALSRRGFVDYLDGHYDSARRLFDEGLALARAAGDHGAVGEFLNNLGDTCFAQGDLDEAVRLLGEALTVLREVGEGNGLAWALSDLGHALAARGDIEAARTPLREALELARRMGNRRRLTFTVAAVAILAAAAGQVEQAIRLEAAATVASAAIGAVRAKPIRDLWARRMVLARQAAGDRAAAIEAAGRALTFEQAVDEALAWLSSPHEAAPGATAAARAEPVRPLPERAGT